MANCSLCGRASFLRSALVLTPASLSLFALYEGNRLEDSWKGLPKWTEKFRIPDTNLEYTPDDGFSWRKYGQKDILGAKFPRLAPIILDLTSTTEHI